VKATDIKKAIDAIRSGDSKQAFSIARKYIKPLKIKPTHL
jgi:hypothetical protein